MQHQLHTTNQHPSDLTHCPPPDSSPLAQLSQVLGHGWAAAKQTITTLTSALSLSFIRVPRTCPCQESSLCLCRPRRKGPSKVTLKLIKEINNGFDPMELSAQRWLADEQRGRKEEKQVVADMMERYENYSNENRVAKRESIYSTVKDGQLKESEFEVNLWQISQSKLKNIKVQIQDWQAASKQDNLDSEPASSPPSLSDESSPSQHRQVSPSKKPIAILAPDQSDKTAEKAVERCETQKQVKQTKKTEDRKDDSHHLEKGEAEKGQLQTSPEKTESKAKLNPFLTSGTPPKSKGLMDMIINDTSFKRFSNPQQPSIKKPNSSLQQPSQPRPDPSPSNTHNQPPNTQTTSPTLSWSPRQSGPGPIRKGSIGSPNQSSSSDLFSHNYISNLSQKYTQPSAQTQPSESNNDYHTPVFNSWAQQRGNPSSNIHEMFGKQSKPVSPHTQSIFSDLHSERTERKVLQGPSRKRQRKHNDLRVS